VGEVIRVPENKPFQNVNVPKNEQNGIRTHVPDLRTCHSNLL
jgi:hypothetical protein